MNKFIFFFGGHDAEMCEIRSILKQHSIPFYDKNLSWGAALSAYQKELTYIKDETPVFIELNLDIPFPDNSIIIDHHGEKAGMEEPTSIEQVAELLGIQLTHRQQLIAANDRAHIKGMTKAGATTEEIAEIREYDRRCQGVTEEEENLAEEICKKFGSVGNLDILEIPFKHTSPITDRLLDKYQNLLLLSPESINFFGSGEIVLELAKEFKKCWYGGNLPEEGFWGMDITSKNQVDDIKSLLVILIKK